MEQTEAPRQMASMRVFGRGGDGGVEVGGGERWSNEDKIRKQKDIVSADSTFHGFSLPKRVSGTIS